MSKDTDVGPENASVNGNYGIMALILLAASAFAFFYGVSLAANTLSCALTSHSSLKSAGDGVTLGQVITACGILGIIISLAFAGAGLATRRGNVSALLTILLVMLPILYYVGQIVFGLPSTSGVTPDITQSAVAAYVNTCPK